MIRSITVSTAIAGLIFALSYSTVRAQLCTTAGPSGSAAIPVEVPMTGKLLTTIEIPVFIHIVRETDGTTGNISDSEARTIITRLNGAYSGTNYDFTLAGIHRLTNGTWAGAVSGVGDTYDTQMKQSLSIDPEHVLNIYVTDVALGSYGYSTLPPFPGSPHASLKEDNKLHGVVLDYTGLDGSDSYYDDSEWAVHEVGHYLGLYHTFQDGCSPTNDLVADTPLQRDASEKADPCPDEALSYCSGGYYNPRNYLDYHNDDCRSVLTSGQKTRINSIAGTYRPSLGSSSINVSGDLKVNSGEDLVLENFTFKFQSGKRLKVLTGSTLAVDDATLTAQGTSWYGVYVATSLGATISNSSILKVRGNYAGVQVSGGGILIEDSQIQVTGGSAKGVQMTGSYTNTVRVYDSDVESSGREAVYASGSNQYLALYNNIIEQISSDEIT